MSKSEGRSPLLALEKKTVGGRAIGGTCSYGGARREELSASDSSSGRNVEKSPIPWVRDETWGRYRDAL